MTIKVRMFMLPGYDIRTQLYESAHSRIYRAIRQTDAGPVILKCLNSAQPSPAQRARFQWEYDLTRRVCAEFVIQAYALEAVGQSLVIVLEDIGAEALGQIRRAQPLSLPEILSIAVKIAHALAAVHAVGLIHKDVNPANLVYNPATQRLHLIDFGLAAQCDVKTTHLGNPETLEGTLPYLAPEQTGRMNRVLDNRADLYAFGVTLYELLTGRRPFESGDAAQLVYEHLAVTPAAPTQIAPDIPPVLSDIVLKLLAKNADDRYQSAQGVRMDLERCLAGRDGGHLQGGLHLQTLSEPSFPLAQDDVVEHFRLPQKLYGREQELAMLLTAFKRVSAAGKPEVLLITGASGTGKSALVHELYRPITMQRGLLLNGKFDQLQRNVPYDAIRQAFDEFVTLLLTEPETALRHWRDRIVAAVGNIGQVVINLAPRLELILGQQPPVAAVGSQETQNRFQLVMQNVLAAIAQPEHPVVLFLDDLQWADTASLNLLKIWLTDPKLRHLLLILAYRDNEIEPGHPVLTLLTDLQQAAIPVATLPVANLSGAHVNALLAETFVCEPEQALPLAEIVTACTDGNAFFTRHLLLALAEALMIWWDAPQRRWNWDVERIRTRDISADAAALMQQKLHRLPPETQTVLGLAACIGNPLT